MGSCCSTSSRMNRNIVGDSLDADITEKEVKSKEGSSSGRWKKIGSTSRRKFRSRNYEGYEQSNQSQNQIHIAGKMCGNGASEVACLYTQQGKKGTNQDAMIVWENYNSRSDTIFCGVFDGHGPFGHMVARKVRDSLPLILYTQWDACSNGDEDSLRKIDCPPGNETFDESMTASLGDQWCEPLSTEEGEKLPEMYWSLKQSMLKAFNLMDMELKLHPTIDCFCSGTTAVTLIKQGRDLVIGNVGDSRAVLARRDLDNSLVAVQLTVDLKPDLPREAARIQQCKGRVFALQDEPEVARVWLPDSDSPGLAMARAFGDFCLKDFGLISVPDVYYLQLTERDEFVILATDGVWDVLSNKEAIDIVASAPGRATAARALVDCAVRAWRLKYPTSKNDDCAVVCLFLDHTPSVSEAAFADDVTKPPEAGEEIAATVENQEITKKDADSYDLGLEHLATRGLDEIVPVSELIGENPTSKPQHKPQKSLAECMLMDEKEEWSALEGVTRVNSLLSLPRFLSGSTRSASWRKR